MHLSARVSLLLLFCFCIHMKSCQAFKNDATEIIYSHVGTQLQDAPSNISLNHARNGGRGASAAQDRAERGQVGCRELRSTKYISDGQCTSLSPIKELVCAGECLPAQMLHNWIGRGYGKRFSSRRNSQDWRCVNDKTRTQRIQLQCQDGSSRTYKITVVTSCKCKRYSRQQNESGSTFEEAVLSQPQLLHKHKTKTKKKLGKTRLNENWHEVEP